MTRLLWIFLQYILMIVNNDEQQTHPVVVPPNLSVTRTAIAVAFLATPYVADIATGATPVPCPSSSSL